MNVDVNFLIEELKQQRNRALDQGAAAIAALNSLHAEIDELKSKIATDEPPPAT